MKVALLQNRVNPLYTGEEKKLALYPGYFGDSFDGNRQHVKAEFHPAYGIGEERVESMKMQVNNDFRLSDHCHL
jgi:hypothetical protein